MLCYIYCKHLWICKCNFICMTTASSIWYFRSAKYLSTQCAGLLDVLKSHQSKHIVCEKHIKLLGRRKLGSNGWTSRQKEGNGKIRILSHITYMFPRKDYHYLVPLKILMSVKGWGDQIPTQVCDRSRHRTFHSWRSSPNKNLAVKF